MLKMFRSSLTVLFAILSSYYVVCAQQTNLNKVGKIISTHTLPDKQFAIFYQTTRSNKRTEYYALDILDVELKVVNSIGFEISRNSKIDKVILTPGYVTIWTYNPVEGINYVYMSPFARRKVDKIKIEPDVNYKISDVLAFGEKYFCLFLNSIDQTKYKLVQYDSELKPLYTLDQIDSEKKVHVVGLKKMLDRLFLVVQKSTNINYVDQSVLEFSLNNKKVISAYDPQISEKKHISFIDMFANKTSQLVGIFETHNNDLLETELLIKNFTTSKTILVKPGMENLGTFHLLHDWKVDDTGFSLFCENYFVQTETKLLVTQDRYKQKLLRQLDPNRMELRQLERQLSNARAEGSRGAAQPGMDPEDAMSGRLEQEAEVQILADRVTNESRKLQIEIDKIETLPSIIDSIFYKSFNVITKDVHFLAFDNNGILVSEEKVKKGTRSILAIDQLQQSSFLDSNRIEMLYPTPFLLNKYKRQLNWGVRMTGTDIISGNLEAFFEKNKNEKERSIHYLLINEKKMLEKQKILDIKKDDLSWFISVNGYQIYLIFDQDKNKVQIARIVGN